MMIDVSLKLLFLFLVIVAASSLATFVLTRAWIIAARRARLVGVNMHSLKKKRIPEGGGIAVIMAIAFAILVYIFIKTFLLGAEANLETFALLVTALFAGFIGFVDDMLGWKVGLKQWQKPLMTIPIAFPLVVINAGVSVVDVPFLGVINFGLLFPLALVPVAIICAANVFNMLGGWNGLEAGMGAIMLATLGLFAFARGTLWLATISFAIVAALLSFLLFNKYPARVFPGDSFTYAMGALIAAVAILGHLEKVALVLFIPYFAEFLIKAKRRFKSECFATLQKDGSLIHKGRMGSLTHLTTRVLNKTLKKVYEQDVVTAFWFVEAILAGIALFIWL